MPKGYWIAHVDVHDMDQYERYRASIAESLKPFKGKFLVRAGQQEVREGKARPRSVVIEFPSYHDAITCYESPDYQAVRLMREHAADVDLLIIEGIE